MSVLKRAFRWVVPEVEQAEDGREKWPSRLAYILACMGGAVGTGNLLRYPSIAYRNSGLQWFIPYFIALFFVGIPVLILEICLGQVYRRGAVQAFGKVSKRLRGLGLVTVYIAFLVCAYYVVIMSWVLTYLRHSFTNPLPWADNNRKFFEEQVLRNVNPVQGNFAQYPGTAIIGETLGWTALTWVFVYLCIFKGASLTGRVVYFTMLFPVTLILILTIRSVTLPNAGRGIVRYVGQWSWAKLGSSQIWIDAFGQIFYTIGIGFGYFVAYSSYHSKYANAVQDSVIIACSDALIEAFAGFAAFGVIGYSNIPPNEQVGSFQLGFITYPEALAKLPGANAWSVFFFLMLYLLGIDSAFAMLEGVNAVVLDTRWGNKPPRVLTVALITLITFLTSIPYTSQFGNALLTAIDKWVIEITLLLSVSLQCSIIPTFYRYKDVVSQTGMKAFVIAQASYFASMLLGVIIGHVNRAAGGAVFVSVLIIGTVTAVLLSDEPELPGPLDKNKYLRSFWWLTSYSGNRLRLDLNAVIAQGKNWSIPALWAPLLKWFSAPFLLVIGSFAYPEFANRMRVDPSPGAEIHRDPLDILGFLIAHIGIAMVVIGLIIPSAFNFLIKEESEDKSAEISSEADSSPESCKDVESCDQDRISQISNGQKDS